MPTFIVNLIVGIVIVVAASIALNSANRRRMQALSQQQGQIWQPTEAIWIFILLTLLLTLLPEIPDIRAWLTEGGPSPWGFILGDLFPFWAIAALWILQPKGPTTWSPKGLTAPAPGLRGYRHRTAIGWDEITRITRITLAYPWSREGWVVRAADGRFVEIHNDQPGHETLLAALHHYRPELDIPIPPP